MISLYDSKETAFTNNGLVVLSDTISCLITEELNGIFECELEYPLDERGKWKYLLEGNIVKADGQLFRIYHKVKTLNSIKINARHIFYDLLDNLLEDVRPTNLSGQGALDWILTHTQYAHPFTSMGDVGGLNTKYFVRKNPVEAIMGTDGIISMYGGELVRDNFLISYLGARGLDRGVLVAYGKNIQGIEETLDTSGLCTRLMPIGKDGLLLPEKYIDSPYIGNYPNPKIKVVEFSECEDEATLRTTGAAYMVNAKIDIPQFNYKIDFMELSKTEEYKDYAVLERVYEGDTVTIRHSRLGLDLKAKVIKLITMVRKDGTKRIEKVELGSFKPNLATGISNAIQAVKQEIVNVRSAYQLAIDNATALITGSNGGNVVIRQDEAGKPYEILIMDTADVMTAVNVWRWNLGGFGHSATGVNGPFDTAITQDGHIVGKFITALLITGDQINGGTINGVSITGSTFKTTAFNYLSIIGSSMKGYNGTDLALDIGVQINGLYNLPYIKFIAGMYEGAPAKTIGLSAAGQLMADIDSIENNLTVYGTLTATGIIYANNGITGDLIGSCSGSASTLSYLGSSRAVPTDTGFTSGITHIGIADGPPPYMAVNTGSSSWGVTIFTSDHSLKTNIVDTTESSLAKILLIKHRQFDWKDGNRHEKVGVISQELMEIDSDFAFEVKQGLDEAGNQKPSLYQPNIPVLIPTITHAIQEMQIEIEDLKARLALVELN